MEAIVETTEIPLFENAHQALTYAYNYSNQQFAKSIMSTLMSAGMRMPSGKGLSGLDGAGQAGMVKARVNYLARKCKDDGPSLDEVHQAEEAAALQGKLEAHVLVARYARFHRECAHCGSMAPTVEWREAVSALVQHLTIVQPGISHLHLRRALVERYFGVKVDMGDMAKRCGVHRTTAAKHYKGMKEFLRKLEERAMKSIEVELQQGGILAKTS